MGDHFAPLSRPNLGSVRRGNRGCPRPGMDQNLLRWLRWRNLSDLPFVRLSRLLAACRPNRPRRIADRTRISHPRNSRNRQTLRHVILPQLEQVHMAREFDSELSRYISMVHAAPKLSREEEEGLLERWYSHSEVRARDELVNTQLRYVVAIALKYKRYGVPVS